MTFRFRHFLVFFSSFQGGSPLDRGRVLARKAEGRMGYWLRGHEGERNNCFSKIQLVGKKFRDKTASAS